MAANPDSALLSALGKPLDALKKLSDDDQKRLVADLEYAQEQHLHSLNKSMSEAFEHIPRFMRGPIRKLLGF